MRYRILGAIGRDVFTELTLTDIVYEYRLVFPVDASLFRTMFLASVKGMKKFLKSRALVWLTIKATRLLKFTKRSGNPLLHCSSKAGESVQDKEEVVLQPGS